MTSYRPAQLAEKIIVFGVSLALVPIIMAAGTCLLTIAWIEAAKNDAGNRR